MKIFCCFICVTLLWALHIVIKQQFFYIYTHIVAACVSDWLTADSDVYVYDIMDDTFAM